MCLYVCVCVRSRHIRERTVWPDSNGICPQKTSASSHQRNHLYLFSTDVWLCFDYKNENKHHNELRQLSGHNDYICCYIMVQTANMCYSDAAYIEYLSFDKLSPSIKHLHLWCVVPFGSFSSILRLLKLKA